MKKHVLKSLTVAAALAILPATAKAEKAVYLMIENGGVVSDVEDAMVTVRAVLAELVELRRRRDTRESIITIVQTASPTEVTWSGTPAQLADQAQEVLNLIAFRNTCSDLVRAYAQVDLSARISRPDDIILINVGPFIHAGFPCGEAEALITLPQAVPAEVMLGELGNRASMIRLLNVHPDQDEMIVNDLEASGVMERARGGMTDLDLLDPAQTRARIGSFLEER